MRQLFLGKGAGEEVHKGMTGNTMLIAQPSPSYEQVLPNMSAVSEGLVVLFCKSVDDVSKAQMLVVNREEYREMVLYRRQVCPTFAHTTIDEAAIDKLPDAAVPDHIKESAQAMPEAADVRTVLQGPSNRIPMCSRQDAEEDQDSAGDISSGDQAEAADLHRAAGGEQQQGGASSKEEHDLQDPGQRAQHTEGHDKVAHDIVRVVVKSQVGLIKRETERDPIQEPLSELDEEQALCPFCGNLTVESPAAKQARHDDANCSDGGKRDADARSGRHGQVLGQAHVAGQPGEQPRALADALGLLGAVVHGHKEAARGAEAGATAGVLRAAVRAVRGAADAPDVHELGAEARVRAVHEGRRGHAALVGAARALDAARRGRQSRRQ